MTREVLFILFGNHEIQRVVSLIYFKQLTLKIYKNTDNIVDIKKSYTFKYKQIKDSYF